jgi:hypothetical protein
MTTLIAKYIGKKFLGENAQNKFGMEDPYFETVPATRLDGRPSSKKGKKRRKAIPAGLSDHDAKVLTKVKRRAYRLDMSLFNCCGIRFGWSSVIGIIPAIGDVIDAFMALMVYRTCQQVEGGLPKDVQAKMLFNILLDFAIGITPVLGDVLDALFRANTRNAVELEKFLRTKGQKNLRMSGVPLPAIDPSDPDHFDEQVRHEDGPPPQYTQSPTNRQGTHSTQQNSGTKPGNMNGLAQNAPTSQVPKQNRGSWFSSNKKRQPDIETGIQQQAPDGRR